MPLTYDMQFAIEKTPICVKIGLITRERNTPGDSSECSYV